MGKRLIFSRNFGPCFDSVGWTHLTNTKSLSLCPPAIPGSRAPVIHAWNHGTTDILRSYDTTGPSLTPLSAGNPDSPHTYPGLLTYLAQADRILAFGGIRAHSTGGAY